MRLDVLVGQVNQDLSGQRAPLILGPPGQQQDIYMSSSITVFFLYGKKYNTKKFKWQEYSSFNDPPGP